jgi:2-methylcitrate dehydratase
MLCEVEVVTSNGERHSRRVAYHKGHYKNPLSDIELEDKFRSLAGPVLAKERVEGLLERLWRLETVEDLGEIFELTRI